ncbi:uncharacterized protein LY89DRAFT_184077 [Mollisia scopiformis]|uniref:Uncharacterized protein n=1 Tax=Mollisia scopiformis TaxID=149040 RepID=A0A194XTN4_MOLSC|nr:uncharacterized protein LY89DRAFT_184077 [Mollisia scopiformis]KUJ23501.1 hypothetical protein LY89DRAFT_184077 [Mollisia scopiformis]
MQLRCGLEIIFMEMLEDSTRSGCEGARVRSQCQAPPQGPKATLHQPTAWEGVQGRRMGQPEGAKQQASKQKHRITKWLVVYWRARETVRLCWPELREPQSSKCTLSTRTISCTKSCLSVCLSVLLQVVPRLLSLFLSILFSMGHERTAFHSSSIPE